MSVVNTAFLLAPTAGLPPAQAHNLAWYAGKGCQQAHACHAATALITDNISVQIIYLQRVGYAS
jgi:hypothetical protein